MMSDNTTPNKKNIFFNEHFGVYSNRKQSKLPTINFKSPRLFKVYKDQDTR